MTGAETLYTFRTAFPDVMQEGRANSVSMPVYRDNAVVTPSAATFKLLAPGNREAIATAAATIGADGIATYTVPAAVLDHNVYPRGEGWQEVWTLTLGGTPYTVDRPAAMALRPITPCLGVAELIAEYADIAGQAGGIDLQTLIDKAWGKTVRRWIREGGLTYIVKDPYILQDAHRELALANVWMQLHAMRPAGAYVDLADRHRAQYEAEWGRINVLIDENQDGVADDVTRRIRRGTVLNLNAPPSRRPNLGARFTGRSSRYRR